MSEALTRRELLAGTLALAGFSLVGGSCGGEAGGDGGAGLARLRSLLEQWFGTEDLDFMIELGREVEYEIVTADSVTFVWESDRSDEEILQGWRELLDLDFATDMVQVVRGYCLGQTEAGLCWLAAELL